MKVRLNRSRMTTDMDLQTGILKQLPYPSLPEKQVAPKRMRPPLLRRDHWTMMAHVQCQDTESAEFLLSEYLRYRRLREVAPMTKEEQYMPLDKRRRYFMRLSVPHTVADLADIISRRWGSSIEGAPEQQFKFHWGSLTDRLWTDKWPECVEHLQYTPPTPPSVQRRRAAQAAAGGMTGRNSFIEDRPPVTDIEA